MTIDLPRPIAAYVEANSRLDRAGMEKAFTRDAVILDQGKRFEGPDQRRQLFEDEVLPVRAIFTPDAVRGAGDQLIVEGPVAGDFKGSPIHLVYRFTLEHDAIKVLEITR